MNSVFNDEQIEERAREIALRNDFSAEEFGWYVVDAEQELTAELLEQTLCLLRGGKIEEDSGE